MRTYYLDDQDLTVYVSDDLGERRDLNAHGKPIETADELRAFVYELHEQGAYSEGVRDNLDMAFYDAEVRPVAVDVADPVFNNG